MDGVQERRMRYRPNTYLQKKMHSPWKNLLRRRSNRAAHYPQISIQRLFESKLRKEKISSSMEKPVNWGEITVNLRALDNILILLILSKCSRLNLYFFLFFASVNRSKSHNFFAYDDIQFYVNILILPPTINTYLQHDESRHFFSI
jgi:hypothetical protein